MKILTLSDRHKRNISQWSYHNEYAQFNYALQRGGWLDKYCCQTKTDCYVVMDLEEIIGLFLFIVSNNNEFRILINPHFLNQGFGKKIVQKALNMAFEILEFSHITLIVRKSHHVAQNLYLKFGFKFMGEKVESIDGVNIEFYTMKLRRTTWQKHC